MGRWSGFVPGSPEGKTVEYECSCGSWEAVEQGTSSSGAEQGTADAVSQKRQLRGWGLRLLPGELAEGAESW